MSSSATKPPVLVAERSGVLIVTIDREHAGNSMSLDTAFAIRDAIRGVSSRGDVRGIVITGAGEKFFCTGGDVKAYRSITTKEELAHTFGAVRDLLIEIENHDLPVIAAINGHALGGGAELALACDIRFASGNATFGFAQSRLGIIPGWDGVGRLLRVVSRSQAVRLLLTAERLTAPQALSYGLVDEISSARSVLDHAAEFLAGLPAAPLAISAVKRAVRVATGSERANGDGTADIFEELWFSDDHREAEAAFAEKRPPVFRGR